MNHLIITSTIFIILFSILAGIDGLYFHIWKYRLYSRPESIYEHKLHTIRTILFIPIIFLFYGYNFEGIALWIGVAIVLADFCIELMDVFSENDSRKNMGGLSSKEYAIHVLLTIFRVFAIALILAAKPASAWNFSIHIVSNVSYPNFISFISFHLMIGTLFIAILHIWVMQKFFRESCFTLIQKKISTLFL